MRKLKYALGGIIALFAFLACDDNTGRLGMDMLPPTDSITASKATYNVTTKSVLAGRVYAKSSIGYVGRFTDPDFGYYESSFLSELYCVENYQFPEEYRVTSYDENGNPKTATGTMVEDDPLVSSDLILYYYNWFGDSLNACRMSVYELNDKWKVDRNDPEREYRYTDIDTESYKGNYLGSITYSAYDTTVPDSVRNATDSDGYSTYVPNLTLQLPKERGEEIFRLNREHPEYFADAESFIENVFPGVYIQSDYGDGTILYVEYIYLTMRFKFYATDPETGLKLTKNVTDDKGEAGTDSIVEMQSSIMASTKEVIQANQLKNDEKLLEKANEKEWTYIKSPAGIFTEATLPYDEIAEELADDTLNAVTLAFTNYNQESHYDYSMDVPESVLLVRKQDVEKFFEDNELPDNITSYTATHNAVAVNQYTFSNIARLVRTCIDEKRNARRDAGDSWDEEKWKAENPDWNKVWLIPVNTVYDDTGSTSNMIGLEHCLEPSYAKLKGGESSPLTLEVTYTTFHD